MGSVVGVAQLVEHLVVVQDVAGSSPVTHPNDKDPGLIPWVFVIEGSNMAGGTWEEVAEGDRRLPSLHEPIHSLNRSS